SISTLAELKRLYEWHAGKADNDPLPELRRGDEAAREARRAVVALREHGGGLEDLAELQDREQRAPLLVSQRLDRPAPRGRRQRGGRLVQAADRHPRQAYELGRGQGVLVVAAAVARAVLAVHPVRLRQAGAGRGDRAREGPPVAV